MREISPAKNQSAEEYLQITSRFTQNFVENIRKQKTANARPLPSPRLIDRSSILNREDRARLLDKIASLVDENLTGRSDMCEQFADLLALSLMHLGINAKAVSGTAIYFDENRTEIFRWKHYWVRASNDVIDGNIDSADENPRVPKSVQVNPYWGPVSQVPSDRFYRMDYKYDHTPDNDVMKVWWPDLIVWIDTNLKVDTKQ